MALIDIEVVRDGKWVSTSDTDPIVGEPCVEITDGPGWYAYALTTYASSDGRVIIWDTDESHEKEEKFNKLMADRKLPEYFSITAIKAVEEDS